jgi:hypothetical protein
MNVALDGEASGSHRDAAMDQADGEPRLEEIWQEPADRLLIRLRTNPAGLAAAVDDLWAK